MNSCHGNLVNTIAAGAALLLTAVTPSVRADPLEDIMRFQVDRRAFVRQFDPVFQRPIEHGKDAIPVGNGDLAAVAWQPEHLTWMLNKSDIGVASQAARVRIETPGRITERVGRLETRLSLANATAAVTYEGGKLPESAGWMWRGREGAAPEVTDRDLGSVHTRFFVPEGRNVFLLSYREEAELEHPLSIVFERWPQKEYGGELKTFVHGDTLAVVYSIERNGYADSYAAVLAFEGFTGATPERRSDHSLGLQIPSSTRFEGRIAVAVVTSLESDDPLTEATRLAKETLAMSETALIAAQDHYWQSFWDRFFVDSGQPYLTALYHIALYELGITSRGARPVKFNGALNLFSEKARKWGAGYWCHNQTSVYLPLYAANQYELADNFHDWIADILPEAIKAGRKYHQTQGAYYPEVMSFDYEVKSPGEAVEARGMDLILSSGVRYALLMWNRYRYSLDEVFLMEKAYPVIRHCAEFYVNYATLGEDGLYHIEPTLSWEEPPVGRNAHADGAAWRAILQIAIEAGTLLDIDKKQLSIWRDRLDKAPPYPVHDGLFSVVERMDGTPEPTTKFQWQLPNLSSVFPYEVIGITSPPEDLERAEATFNHYRFNADAGHEYLPVVAARLGKAELWRGAMFRYIQFMQGHDQGLFHYYNLAGSKVMEVGGGDDAHPYLEGSGILATAVNEMLLQSHDGIIRVFPAVPERWPARFKLRAAGSFMVASEHRGRTGIPYIAIQPVEGGERLCRVVIPWDEGAELTENGRKVSFEQDQDTAVFNAVPDSLYVLTPKGKGLEDVAIEKLDTDNLYSPARLGNVWIGGRDGPMNHSATFPLW